MVDRDDIIAAATACIMTGLPAGTSGRELFRCLSLYNEIMRLDDVGEQEITAKLLESRLNWPRSNVDGKLAQLLRMGVVTMRRQKKHDGSVCRFVYRPAMDIELPGKIPAMAV